MTTSESMTIRPNRSDQRQPIDRGHPAVPPANPRRHGRDRRFGRRGTRTPRRLARRRAPGDTRSDPDGSGVRRAPGPAQPGRTVGRGARRRVRSRHNGRANRHHLQPGRQRAGSDPPPAVRRDARHLPHQSVGPTDQPAHPRSARLAVRQQRQRLRPHHARRDLPLRIRDPPRPDLRALHPRLLLVPPPPARQQRGAGRRRDGRRPHRRGRARRAPRDPRPHRAAARAAGDPVRRRRHGDDLPRDGSDRHLRQWSAAADDRDRAGRDAALAHPQRQLLHVRQPRPRRPPVPPDRLGRQPPARGLEPRRDPDGGRRAGRGADPGRAGGDLRAPLPRLGRRPGVSGPAGIHHRQPGQRRSGRVARAAAHDVDPL